MAELKTNITNNDEAVRVINEILSDISCQLPVSNFRERLEQKLEALKDAAGRGINEQI
jgi:hypothetical protein